MEKQHNALAIETIKDIQAEIAKDPKAIVGKYSPEKLKGNLTGWYSRRVTKSDRFVYRPCPDDESIIEVIQCKGHY